MRKLITLSFLLSLLVFVPACTKEVEEPDNPFSIIDYGALPSPEDTINPASITGLHRNVFLPKCAVPGCHDGNFEPDFRSVQSSYSTMVYATVTKNNDAGTFTYRVVPGDTAMSVLHERITNCCFVNQDDRMPQDNIGTGLPQADINNISAWILDGAKSANGTVPVQPDLMPVITYFAAINTTFDVELSAQNNRVDSIIFNPFKIAAGTASFYVSALVTDDQTPINQFQVNQLKISTEMDDFSAAQSFNATYVEIPGQAPVWLVNVNSAAFVPGQTYFMRYYVNDGQHPTNTEFPEDDSIIQYKTYWSFIVTP